MPATTDDSRLRDAVGGYTMVAIDQRESLRVMMRGGTTKSVTDAQLGDFKVAVAKALSPHASALLVDTDLGLGPIADADALDPGCRLVVAVDRITYRTDGTVERTELRTDLLGAAWDERVAGLKFLLLWSPGGWIGGDAEAVPAFVEGAKQAGLESVLEVVVRESDGSMPTDNRQAELLVAAAMEMSEYGATLYKTEVPFRGRAADADVIRVSEELTRVLPCPWVVLSSGVAATDFPRAVRNTALGGASGFLAGRAVWSSATGLPAHERDGHLRSDAVTALHLLSSTLHEALAEGSRPQK